MWLNLPSIDGWELDLVGLLAILGEASVSEVMHPLTASRWVWLPRLLPAPHALILPKRKVTPQPNTNARVVGVSSGNMIEHLTYFADALHRIDLLETKTVQVVSVAVAEDFTHFETKLSAPLNLLTIFSSLATVGLVAWAAVIQDGPAVLAITFLAFSGCFMSIAAYWSVEKPNKPVGDIQDLPVADVVIFEKGGAFVVVRCDEATARTLYFNDSQRCNYPVKTPFYESLVLLGTFLLMAGIVFIRNCSRVVQFALGISYLALNGFYTLAALLHNASRLSYWDFTKVQIERISKHEKIHDFTETLWEVIFETRESDWAKVGRIAPNNTAWTRWLEKAKEAANDLEVRSGRKKFQARQVLDEELTKWRAEQNPAPPKSITPEHGLRENHSQEGIVSDDNSPPGHGENPEAKAQTGDNGDKRGVPDEENQLQKQ